MRKITITVDDGSLSARRAWIEIILPPVDTSSVNVALRKESVDRNVDPDADTLTDDVALRKESVDRNLCSLLMLCPLRVALRKESVDRNIFLTLTVRNVPSRSPQGERG